MKFTIITPTILRDTLDRTCRSIEEGTHTDWQHIVIIDKPLDKPLFPRHLLHPRREWIMCGIRHNNRGNWCRHSAYPLIKGDYVLYLDDDDYYVNDCLAVLNYSIFGEDWGVFPTELHGNYLFRHVPGLCNTASCQWYHKPVIKGVQMRWPGPLSEAGQDGRLVDLAMELSQPAFIDPGFILSRAPKMGGGS